MSTLLRVLVIVITVLSAAALYFAFANFDKRQILLGRNAALVSQVRNIAQTIEAQDAKATDAASLDVTKDISDVTDRVLANPEKESIFDGYPVWLETQNLPTLNFASDEKQIQLRTFFALDEVGKVKISPVDGQRVTSGPGTMQELLDQLFDRSKAQQATLNKTRAEMGKLRERFTESVDEINKLKGDGRLTKKDLTDKKEEVVGLQNEKTQLEANVAKLTRANNEAKAELADLKNEVETLQEAKVGLLEELASVNKMNTDLKEALKLRGSGSGSEALAGGSKVVALSAGDKGKIIEANDEFKFAIIEFSNDAMAEMMGSDREQGLPQLDMHVRRIGRESASGEFVTRVKLRQPVRGKNIVVADILSDFQQIPVEKGDVVFF